MPKTKLMAILSLVFGILGLHLTFIPIVGLFAILLVIPGIILGIMALIKAAKNHTPGKGFAIAGLICGGVALSFGLVVQAVAIPIFMKHRSESQTATCISNMHALVTAAESWLTRHPGETPTLTDLCGPEDTKYLRREPTCPKDGSQYQIRLVNGAIEVECRSGDPTHVMSDYRW